MSSETETENLTEQETETSTEEKETSLIGEAVEEKEESQTEEFVPLTAESLRLPEGFEPIEELQTEFLDLINNQEISVEERSNGLIGLLAKNLQMAEERESQLWDKTLIDWKDEVKADPEVGGAKLDGVLSNVGKLVNEYGSDELIKVFALTGAGNNVHVVKFLNKVAGALVESQTAVPGSPGEDKGSQTAAQKMYPSMKG